MAVYGELTYAGGLKTISISTSFLPYRLATVIHLQS